MGEIEWNWCFADARREAEETGMLMFVLFTAPDTCRYCVELEERILERPEFARWVSGKIPVRVDFSEISGYGYFEDRRLKEEIGLDGFPGAFLVEAAGGEAFSLGELCLDSMEELEASEASLIEAGNRERIEMSDWI